MADYKREDIFFLFGPGRTEPNFIWTRLAWFFLEDKSLFNHASKAPFAPTDLITQRQHRKAHYFTSTLEPHYSIITPNLITLTQNPITLP